MIRKIEEKLAVQDIYSGVTVAHACAKNGHTKILLKVIDLYPELCAIEDYSGNLPLHSLCWNT